MVIRFLFIFSIYIDIYIYKTLKKKGSYLFLGDGDGVPHDGPDDGLEAGRGRQTAVIPVELFSVVW